MEENKDPAQTLADAHWKYVSEVLAHAGTDLHTIRVIGFHYKSAFVHGFKHGREDRMEE